MKDFTNLRNDLRAFFLNVKDYLQSGGDATICAAKENCRFACFGSLPWEVSSSKFSQVLDWVPGSWEIESQINYCIDWVEKEMSKKNLQKFFKMEKIKELWRKWDKINQLCQRKCEFYSTWERNQAQYDYWSAKLFYSGKMLFRIEQMYGLVVHYSAFGRLSWV